MFSIVIPTLQINKTVLMMLLKQLVHNNFAGEIIVIDNSLKGIDFKSDKVRLITPKKNMYVNPAWNLGVKEAKYDYIGLVNDDLIFPENFLEQVFNFLKNNPDTDFLGLDTIKPMPPEGFENYPMNTQLEFNKISERCLCWGCAMFFKKEKYTPIPEKLKIFSGDDWLFDNAKNNYKISNSGILHLHCLSSGKKEFEKIELNDMRIYKKINPNSDFEDKRKPFENIFSITKNYETNQKIIRILGLKFSSAIKKYKRLDDIKEQNKQILSFLEYFKARDIFIDKYGVKIPAECCGKGSRFELTDIRLGDLRENINGKWARIKASSSFEKLECINEIDYDIKKEAIAADKYNVIIDGLHKCKALINNHGEEHVVKIVKVYDED